MEDLRRIHFELQMEISRATALGTTEGEIEHFDARLQELALQFREELSAFGIELDTVLDQLTDSPANQLLKDLFQSLKSRQGWE